MIITSFNLHGITDIKLRNESVDDLKWLVLTFIDKDGRGVGINVFDRCVEDLIPASEKALRKRIDDLENEVNAVELINGLMERELEDLHRQVGSKAEALAEDKSAYRRTGTQLWRDG